MVQRKRSGRSRRMGDGSKDKVTLVIEGDQATRLKQIMESMPEREERAHMLDELIKENIVRHEALTDALRPEEKKPWNWKRSIFAAVSGIGGAALAFFLHKKCPVLNYAAAAQTGTMAFDAMDLKDHKIIGGCLSGVGARYAHDNFWPAEVALSGVSYGTGLFKISEGVYEAGVESIAQYRQWIDQANAEVEQEEAEEAQEPQQEEEPAHVE